MITAVTPPVASTTGREIEHADELLVTLGRALHQAGLPSHRLEAMLGRMAARLGTKVHAFSLPTGLLLCIGRGRDLKTVLVRLPPRPTDLGRLRLLMIEAEALADGRTHPAESVTRIEALSTSAPGRHDRMAQFAGLALSAAAFSVFFGGGVRELLVAATVGIVVGLLALATRGRRGASRRYELMAATAAGLIATMADRHLGGFEHWIPLASGLIVLLPGLALVDAIEELANGHLTSGAARMAGVGIVFLALVFGVMMGVSLARFEGESPSRGPGTPFPPWAALPALGVVALGSVCRFRARLQDWPVILMASAVAYFGAKMGSRLGNPLLGPFVGALVLGLAANLYSRYRLPIPQLLLVPGLALLVPGSIGLRSLDALLSGDTAMGVEHGFRMFMMAMALVAGLLFSNALVRTPANDYDTL
ncbi:MAG TPA: threonine/serine exporter family protein [Isosphaeraceae bacterium]|nr:threonine/serine exporter family protein [Isosphaeraceae bacterium]